MKSARANLVGFFSNEGQEWNDNLDLQEIPIHTIPLIEDYVLASDKRCDHFDYVMIEFMNTTDFRGIWKKHKSLIDSLEVNIGKKLPSITEINILYDTLFIEKLRGLQ